MAEDDIYWSKGRYENFKENIKSFAKPPSKTNVKRKYYCRNPDNLQYFNRLFINFDAKDLSYIRRLRILQSMRFIAHHTNTNLQKCGRDDINEIMAAMHNAYNSPKSKQTFIKDIKAIWKILCPENDERGRLDETLTPYVVRHLSAKIDKSRQKLRKDKLSWEEFEQIVNYFSSNPKIQAFLTLSLESLARPQELLYVKIGDIELHENYAKIFISEHGKEGTGMLQCIDSYPYLLKWLDMHPLKKNKEAFLFTNAGYKNTLKQLKPNNLNKYIRKACKDLGINKPITCYSLKRNGVTIRRLRGESDVEIQHAARWSSTQQLKTYDLSSQDEAFKLALEKRGLIQPGTKSKDILRAKSCPFCNATVGSGEIICSNCRHPLDRNSIVKEKHKDEEILRLNKALEIKERHFEDVEERLMQKMMQKIKLIQSGQNV